MSAVTGDWAGERVGGRRKTWLPEVVPWGMGVSHGLCLWHPDGGPRKVFWGWGWDTSTISQADRKTNRQIGTQTLNRSRNFSPCFLRRLSVLRQKGSVFELAGQRGSVLWPGRHRVCLYEQQGILTPRSLQTLVISLHSYWEYKTYISFFGQQKEATWRLIADSRCFLWRVSASLCEKAWLSDGGSVWLLVMWIEPICLAWAWVRPLVVSCDAGILLRHDEYRSRHSYRM